MFNRTGQIVYKTARRIVIAVVGGTILLIGLVMLLTPGPGVLVIAAGLGILGLEFAWARRWLGEVKKRSGKALDSVRQNGIGKQRRYFSFQQQTLHYFSRPHSKVLRQPVTGKAAWTAEDVREDSQWQYSLNAEQISELQTALETAKGKFKFTQALTKNDFPLPGLQPLITAWRSNIESGLGFQLIRGIPVEQWSPQDAEIFFWCFGLHLGIPGAQNPEGDLLGHVIDTSDGQPDTSKRYYQTSNNIAYHCDAADAVGLLCLQPAQQGGESRIVSSISIYNEILTRRPDLINRLYRPFLLDAHGENGINTIPIRPCRYYAGQLRTFFHSDYFRSVQQYPKVGPLPEDVQTLLDEYDSIANSPEYYLSMDLHPGDIQLLSNHTILHARTAYTDFAEPERRRHLLRLWLSFPNRTGFTGRMRKLFSKTQLAGSLIKAKLAFSRH